MVGHEIVGNSIAVGEEVTEFKWVTELVLALKVPPVENVQDVRTETSNIALI